MFKPLLMVGLALTFTGCATTSNDNSQKREVAPIVKEDEKGRKIICSREGRVGTNFKKTQCWTVEEYKAKQERDRQKMRDIQANGSTMEPKR